MNVSSKTFFLDANDIHHLLPRFYKNIRSEPPIPRSSSLTSLSPRHTTPTCYRPRAQHAYEYNQDNSLRTLKRQNRAFFMKYTVKSYSRNRTEKKKASFLTTKTPRRQPALPTLIQFCTSSHPSPIAGRFWKKPQAHGNTESEIREPTFLIKTIEIRWA